MDYFHYKIEKVKDILRTSLTEGLPEASIADRLTKNGYNEIIKGKTRSNIKIFLEQFKNLLVALLIVAAILSLYLGSCLE